MEREDFIKRLVELRTRNNLSARDLSLSVGMNHGYINSVENGLHYPTMENFLYICDFLKVTPQEFFDADFSVPANVRELYDLVKKLPSSQVDGLIELVKTMI